MAHQVVVTDEQYEFKPATKRTLFFVLGAGVLLFIIGLIMAMAGGSAHHEGQEHGAGHHSSLKKEELVASSGHEAASEGHGHEAAAAGGHHEETPLWLKRLYTTLWMNNIYFVGLGIIGLFFVAIQYAAQAGWSAGIKRIPLAMGAWIPVSGVITLVLWFIVKHDVFHWTHEGLYAQGTDHFDKIINKKAPSSTGPWPAVHSRCSISHV